jgi:PAS domain S-box-containing protein
MDSFFQELEELYNKAPCGYHSLDSEGKFIRINDTELKMLGYSREEVLGRQFSDLITPESLSIFQQNFPIFKQRGWVNDLEFQFIRKDGTLLPVSLSATAIKDEAGNFLMSRSVVIDISERQATLRQRKQLEAERQVAEANLRATEERYRLMFESNPNPMWFFAPDTLAFLEVNQAAIAHYGYSQAEFLQMTIADIRPDEDVPALRQASIKLIPGHPHVGVWRHRKKDGSIIDVEVTAYAFSLPDKQSNLALIRDITALKQIEAERQQAETALIASEEKYRTLFNSIDEGFCIIEMIFDENEKPVDYRFLEINPIFEQQTGLANAQGKTARQLIPDFEEQWFEIYGNIALTGQSIRFENRSEVMHRWFDTFAFRFGEPEHRQVAILFQDISDRKKAETSLQEAQESLEIAIEAAQMGTWHLDLTRDVSSKRSLRHDQIFGYQTPQLEWGESIARQHIVEADKKIFDAAFAHARETGKLDFEVRVQWSDGSIHWMAARGHFYFDEQGNPVKGGGVNFDISDRKQAELAREKFLAVGSDLQVITGSNGYFHWVSPTFQQTLGHLVPGLNLFILTTSVHLSPKTPVYFLMTKLIPLKTAICTKTAPIIGCYGKPSPTQKNR